MILLTSIQEVRDVFDASFTDTQIVGDGIFKQWFKMAIGEYSREIEPIRYNDETATFDVDLPQDAITLLGFIVKRFYCERTYNKIIKKNNIIAKDITLNATDSSKARAKEELDYVNLTIKEMFSKLKPSAYN